MTQSSDQEPLSTTDVIDASAPSDIVIDFERNKVLMTVTYGRGVIHVKWKDAAPLSDKEVEDKYAHEIGQRIFEHIYKNPKGE